MGKRNTNLQNELCLLLRKSWIQLNSGLPRSAVVTRVSLRRGVVIIESILFSIFTLQNRNFEKVVGKTVKRGVVIL